MKLGNEDLVDLLMRIDDGLDTDDELIIDVFDVIYNLITELLACRNAAYGRNVDTASVPSRNGTMGMTMISVPGIENTLPYAEQLQTGHA